ncbi:MAG: hypothetical protein N2049_10145 [Anaerolineales bacterium]|nr:hypothetical protein [Anaerolineales bacterium]MCX7609563.1 hypothetical protein [Anaerolineales bacterium]MDW8226933.1 hypothetical protein [Anaerolineales bacterium]
MFVTDWLAWATAFGTSAGILISRNWRINLILTALQYVSVFWFLQSHWSLLQAAAFLIAGWMSCAILAIAHQESAPVESSASSWPQGRLFRLTVTGIVLLVTLVGATRLNTWLTLSFPLLWGSLLLLGIGILLLGLSLQPLRIILGLLTTLAGFAILYAAVEKSVLVISFLILINLGLALAGSYFIEQTSETRYKETA